MRILSIDYDYFQQVSEETLISCYPDGVDLPTDLTIMTWASHYANPRTEKCLADVAVNRNELDAMKEILLNQPHDIPVLIANSHRHIYDFIHDFCDEDDLHSLDNVDMHHDMFNDNEQIDCGNWVGHILKEYDKHMGLRWICNPISLEVFGLEDHASDMKGDIELFPTSLKCLKDDIYDMIFLCRSDTWTPPHLDDGFSELIDVIKLHFASYSIEESVTKKRDYEEYASVIREANERLFKQMKEKTKEKSER